MTPKEGHLPDVEPARVATRARARMHTATHTDTPHPWGIPLHLDNSTVVSILILANFVFNVEQLSLVCIYFSGNVPGGEAVCFLRRNPGSPIRE